MPVNPFLTDYLKFNAENSGTKTALVFEGRSYTWAKLWEKVEASTGYLLEALGDNKKQKVVSLLLTNSPEFVISYLAILHAGHIAMPLDPAYKKLELDAIIDQISPVLIITDERYQDQISSSRIIMIKEVLAGRSSTLKPLRISPQEQIASLTFTSGTTGHPKAAPYTHANHIWNIKVCSKVWDWTANDTLLISLPLSHWYGLVMGLSGALYHGNTLYLQQQAFDPKSTLELLGSGKISIFTHVPLAYMKLLNQDIKSYDLSNVRLLISGGGPLPPTIWHEFNRRFKHEIIETYGSSETGRIAANNLKQKSVGSAGELLPEVNLKISGSGEVIIKSPGVFPGYFHNLQATKASSLPGGWWRSGDIGELKKGFLYLKGREQERIRKFGYTISPRDVEWALLKNQSIKEVYVMGRQISASSNDELIYFIAGNITKQQLSTYCKDNLLFAWRPDRVIFVDSLPRTPSGKPSLRQLRKMV